MHASTSSSRTTVLGIETSCDETAAAVVVRDGTGRGLILSNVVRAQWAEHRPFGGVVPELAARAHVECLDQIVAAALAEADTKLADVDAIAVTVGPGLIGGLMVGTITAEALGLATKKPVLAINHLEGHALTAGLTDGVRPPYLLLLVSGGHTQLLAVHKVGSYERLGTTIDDALGEAFDKTAKLLGLGLPGGPQVEIAARAGDSTRFQLPRPMAGRPEPHFSLAGLKTAVRIAVQRTALANAAADGGADRAGGGKLSRQDICDIAASFEAAAAASVCDRVLCARRLLVERGEAEVASTLVVAGGVAANQRLRSELTGLCGAHAMRMIAPPIALCGDNAAMIAWVGLERMAANLPREPLIPRARWPLDASAQAILGKGRLGAKA